MKIPDKDFDYLFPQAKVNPVELRGYVWKVIVDPTRNDDDRNIHEENRIQLQRPLIVWVERFIIVEFFSFPLYF